MGCMPAGLFVTLQEKLTAAGKKEPAKGLEAKTSEAVERKPQKWEYTLKTSPAIKQK